MEIRIATKDDIPGLVELNKLETWEDPSIWSSLSQAERWSEGLWWSDEHLFSWYIDSIHSSDGHIIVAVDENDKIVGELDYCRSFDITTKFQGRRDHIIWLLTHPENRRQGIASKLVNYLRTQSNLPIWVEAEDIRSTKFYDQRGKILHHISNWKLSITDITEDLVLYRHDYQELSLEEFSRIHEQYRLIVGRYYAPTYDLMQLTNSDPVSQYMWGNTDKASVFRFSLDTTVVYAIMTQYPRIWVNPEYDQKPFQQILSSIFLYIFEMGFDTIYIQIYHDSQLDTYLRGHNFTCTIPDDPVFQLD